MADRILVIDDDESVAQLVADALAVVHFDVTTVHNPSDAIVEAKNSRFALIVSDVDMPGMNGFACRDRIRQFPAHAKTPFLFMSSADRSIEMEIVAHLEEDKLLIKPFTPAELRRTVFALLEPVNVERGNLPAALSSILDRVAAERESGVLSAVQGTRAKRVVFQDGKIVFAASNDPRDLIGQALLRTGLVKEKDLLEAFSMTGMKKDSTGTPFLAAALTAMRKVTPEQTQAVFVGKIKESVLEIFLWYEGMVEYLKGPVEKSDAPFAVALDTAEIRQEGERRREKWRRVVQVLPDSTVTFKRVGEQWPDAIAKNPGDKLLTKMIDRGLSMAQILVELRGQDYAVGVRLATLVLQKIIRIAPPSGFRPIKPVKPDTVPDGQTLAVTESTFTGLGSAPPVSAEDLLANVDVPDENELLRRLKGGGGEEAPLGNADPKEQPSATAVIMTRGLGAFRLGDLVTARAAFEEVLARDPLNALARTRVQEVDAAAAKALRDAGLTNDARVELVPEKLGKRELNANDTFVLNRIAEGSRSIGELLQICPLTEREVLSVVQRFLKQGVLRRR